jgi:hypothetical protein
VAEAKFPQPAVKLSKEKKQAIVEEARVRTERSYLYERDNRREAEIDLQFLAGDQWPVAVRLARGTSRPMLTINHLPQFVRQVTNPTREADIAIKASPVDDNSDPALAKIYNGLIKQIEYQSTAKTVYVTGNEHQAACGIGWWQVVLQYVDDAIFEQEIRIKRVENPLAVYCDPAAVEPDRSDAMWMVMAEKWPRATFKERYPDAAEDDLNVPDVRHVGDGFSWSTEDSVVVAIYYRKVPCKKLLALLADGSTIDATGKGEAELGQLQIVQTRTCDTFEVEKYLLTGSELLEGPIKWPGKHIPLVPVVGAETPMRNGTMRYGIVRFARDPQQLVNFYRTSVAEVIAMAPKSPWLVTDKQIGSHIGEWNSHNQTNKPYLRYTPDPEVAGGRPMREPPPEVPQALVNEANFAAEDIKRVTGIYDASLGARSNETSGVAIRQREAQGDNANSHFADNLVHSLVHTGRILIDLIPKVYDNERVVRLMDEQGQEFTATINKEVMGLDGQPIIYNDLSAARFDVRVTVGKSYMTKRIESLNALTEFAKSMPPESQMLFADLIAKNSDWPGSEELAKRFRNMIPPQALADPNDPNAPKPPGPMDNPEVIAKLEKLAAEIEKLKADTRKTDAEAVKTMAEVDTSDAALHTATMQQLMADWAQQNGQPPPASPDGAAGGMPQPPEAPKGFSGGAIAAAPNGAGGPPQ